ncbi:hypothetical protein [Pedococcus cremeus]|nr:hypothetical protein [Pedococcus cremeus]
MFEGRAHDPYFYGGILEASTTLRSDEVQLIPIEVVSGTGGKAALLSLFDWSRKKGVLRTQKRSGESVLVFMLDRDSDFMTGGTRRSPHVVYTKRYDVEAEIFANADAEKALGSHLSLTPQEANALVTHLGDWRGDLANLWRTWILLCCIARVTRAQCDVTFARASAVNDPRYSPEDAHLVRAKESSLRRVTGLKHVDYADLRSRMDRRLTRLYERGEADQVLKGKWLPGYLDEAVKGGLPGRHVKNKGKLGSSITESFAAALSFNGAWVRHYLDPLEAL